MKSSSIALALVSAALISCSAVADTVIGEKAEIGIDVIASGKNAIALGHETVASGEYSTAFGKQTEASGQYSTAFGWLSEANSFLSFSFGYRTKAYGNLGVAFGSETLAGFMGTAFGSNTEARAATSTAFGYGTIAKARSSTAIGDETIAQAQNSMVVGQYNAELDDIDPRVSKPSDPLFVIGNGVTRYERNNALTVLRNGNIGVNTVNPEATLAVDGEVKVDGYLEVEEALKVGGNGSYITSIQAGRVEVGASEGKNRKIIRVSFPNEFTSEPIVTATVVSGIGSLAAFAVSIREVTETGFVANIDKTDGDSWASELMLNWQAMSL